MELNTKQLDQVMRFIKDCDDNELQLKIGDLKLILNNDFGLRIVKEVPVKEVAVENRASLKKEDDAAYVNAPSAGIFYRKPEPDAPSYVEIGSSVEVGDTLALIEVMKTFGQVVSDVNGYILDVLVEDGKLIDSGQPLFLIKRS
jgi:acetyl-CoA carboxylase biotin carboxyl carrier protein